MQYQNLYLYKKMTSSSIYDCQESEKTDDGIKYFFLSEGKEEVLKAVHYMYSNKLNDTRVYNLGFGDYTIDDDKFDDKVNTANGDVYKVLNTVLFTIPRFFEKFPDSCLAVQGSDSNPDFYVNCKPTCTKGCIDICKKQDGRINAYNNFVNKNYDKLSKEYIFYGGIKTNEGVAVEEFVKRKKYDAILVVKKNN